MRMSHVLVAIAIVSILYPACGIPSGPPFKPTDTTPCEVDADCADYAECRTFACEAGFCVFGFMDGAPVDCNYTCSTDSDCAGNGPCLPNGQCGCNTNDDCPTSDCVAIACTKEHVCVMSSPILSDRCPPPTVVTIPMVPDGGTPCQGPTDCAGLGPTPPCYVWACVGKVGVCEQAPIADGLPCTTPMGGSGECHFPDGGNDEVCVPKGGMKP